MEVAQIVESSVTYLTVTFYMDSLNERVVVGGDTLYTYTVRDSAYGEATLVTMTADADDRAAKLLDTFFVTLLNMAVHDGRVTWDKFRQLPAIPEIFSD